MDYPGIDFPGVREGISYCQNDVCERARELAKCELHDIGQISLGESMPHACPYTFEQILDEDWWPGLGRPAGARRLITGGVRPSA